jgi:hypothetical protein
LGETNVFVIFFFHSLSHSLSLSFSLFPPNSYFIQLLSPAGPRGRGHASVRTHGHGADVGVRLCRCGPICAHAYITPVRVLHFCTFSPSPLVGVVGFAWQCLFRLAKGEGVASILRGIPLHFLQSKNSRVVFTLFMLVY